MPDRASSLPEHPPALTDQKNVIENLFFFTTVALASKNGFFYIYDDCEQITNSFDTKNAERWFLIN